MENEIQLINDMIANAIIHGGDAEGPYNQNKLGLYKSMLNYIKAKGLENDYHIIIKHYCYEPNEDPHSEHLKGIWPLPAIVPVSEEPDPMYADYYDKTIAKMKDE